MVKLMKILGAVTIFNINDEVGTLFLSAKYDPTMKYEGEIAAQNVELRNKHKPNHIDFYKGKCPTTNLFSFLDKSAEGQEFKAVESFYRDME